ncbi:MAG: phosphoribosylamine--glycine ligase [Candidatus Dormibacteraeota bacterium]|nr:phosphoribosylamine--glycine ligase [Candidatus Dormibacteraeota bacterium]
MRLLIVGAGAREHALAWKCRQSPLCGELLVAPGNAGTAALARNIPVKPDDSTALLELARAEKVDLAVLGPESAVDAGVGDVLRAGGVPVFGPDRAAGRIESSKAFAKELMLEAGIPTATHRAFSDAEPARAFAAERGGQVAVKADGLALGKGVFVCGSIAESDAAIEALLERSALGAAGSTVVIEERLSGQELSVFGFSDGLRVLPLEPARDYKRALAGDRGPNTGGMGAYSPPAGMGESLIQQVHKVVLQPAVDALRKRGSEYRGVLYAGLMLTSSGAQVIEFNARFGDPEAQVLLPRLESDLVEVMLACARGDLSSAPALRWSPDAAVGVVIASGGYPDSYLTGHVISGLDELPGEVLVFHAGTKLAGQKLITAGGRVLTVVGRGRTVRDARERAGAAAARVRFQEAFYRHDIAAEAT